MNEPCEASMAEATVICYPQHSPKAVFFVSKTITKYVILEGDKDTSQVRAFVKAPIY